MTEFLTSTVRLTHAAVVVVAVVDVTLEVVCVVDVVVVIQIADDVITLNITQYCADCISSLINRKRVFYKNK